MELVEYLRRQFAYGEWANRAVLAALKVSQSSTSKPRQLLAHILSAERLWLERIRKQAQTFPVWPDFSLNQCEEQISELASLWVEYFEHLSSGALSQRVPYQNSKGEAWTNTVADILTHVTLHSAYHRGQIATHMRATGEQPAYTDFIHPIRQGLIE